MGLTEFYKNRIPHYTPLVLLCCAFIIANSSGPSILFWERMQKKSHESGLDIFDWVIAAIFHGGLIGTTILAFRSRKFSDWQDEQKKASETETLRQQTRADFGAK